MAEIQIVYREYGCRFDDCYVGMKSPHCMQCHTMAAKDLGCVDFDDGNDNPHVIPFGDCKNAIIKHRYKGCTVKNYEMKEFYDTYNMHLNCMEVTIGKITYDCDKVVLNGKCIYDELEDENESNA
jgi:hypothetical protein